MQPLVLIPVLYPLNFLRNVEIITDLFYFWNCFVRGMDIGSCHAFQRQGPHFVFLTIETEPPPSTRGCSVCVEWMSEWIKQHWIHH